jgi:thiol-disulfide isomerase/thioredoxin
VVIGTYHNNIILSKTLAPIYEDLAAKLKENKNILLAHVDWTTSQISEIAVKGYPTLKLFKRSKEVVDYEGDRSLNDLARFLREHTTFEWIDIGLPKDEGPDQHAMDGVSTVTKDTF